MKKIRKEEMTSWPPLTLTYLDNAKNIVLLTSPFFLIPLFPFLRCSHPPLSSLYLPPFHLILVTFLPIHQSCSVVDLPLTLQKEKKKTGLIMAEKIFTPPSPTPPPPPKKKKKKLSLNSSFVVVKVLCSMKFLQVSLFL